MKVSHVRLGGFLGATAAFLFLFVEGSLAENLSFELKTIGQSQGETGPVPVVQFTIGGSVYRSLGTSDWKWTLGAMGFDAAAIGPGSGTAVIGVRVERLNDSAGKEIERMGPAAHAALRKKWDAETAGGIVKVLAWEGAPESEELIVRFRRVEGGRELEGCERSFFGEGRLITLGMLSDARQLEMTQSVFAQFNGSFERVER